MHCFGSSGECEGRIGKRGVFFLKSVSLQMRMTGHTRHFDKMYRSFIFCYQVLVIFFLLGEELNPICISNAKNGST
jgi:hypothetical protein